HNRLASNTGSVTSNPSEPPHVSPIAGALPGIIGAGALDRRSRNNHAHKNGTAQPCACSKSADHAVVNRITTTAQAIVIAPHIQRSFHTASPSLCDGLARKVSVISSGTERA